MKHLCYFAFLSMLLSCSWERRVETDEDEPVALEDSLDEEADSLFLYDEEVIPKTADELFDDFFFSFTTDKKFQQQRVVFPLPVVDGSQSASVSQAEWKDFNRFVEQDFYSVIYERESDMELQKDTSVRSVSVEWFHLSEKYVERYNFRRSDEGTWLLTDVEKEETSQTPHASFVEFYAQFSQDTLFQRESIDFPLHLVAESQGEASDGGEMELSPDDWAEFREQMPLPEEVMTNIDYGQAALSENRKILLVEGMSNSLYVKYKFDCTNGVWHLYEIEN